MNKQKLRVFLSVVCFFLSSSAVFAQQFKLDRCFPQSTQIYFSIDNVKNLGDHWSATKLHEALASSQFQEFRDSLRQQIEEAWPNRLGLNLEDFTALPSGEIAGGLIAIPGKKPGFAVMMNVEGNASEVNDFLVRLIRETTSKQNGEATKERIVVGRQSVEATVLTFPNAKTGLVTTAWYVALPQLLIATDQKYLAELLLAKLAGGKDPALAERPEYQAIFKRCSQDSKSKEAPQIRVFANPLLAGEAIRSLVPAEDLKGKSPFAVLSSQGFDGIKGVGGTIDFTTDGYECVYRLMVYMPEAPAKALRALSFTNSDALEPPRWVGKNAARYTLVNLNALTTFNNLGPLFDAFIETDGAWNDVLDSLENDKLGPQVNLRSDLVANFGRQISSSNEFDPEAVADGEKFLFSFNIVEGKEAIVSDALTRMFESDPDFQKLDLAGNVFWQYVPQKKNEKASATTTRPGGVRPGSVRPGAVRPGAARPGAPQATNQPGVEAELIKGAVFGVANGAFYISNDPKQLQNKVFKLSADAPTVLDSPEHKRAMQYLARESAAANGVFAKAYSRNVDGLRENYELFRQGKIPTGKTLGARLLNVILTPPGQKTAREIKFDGSALPPFDSSIADTIGFSVFFGVVENDGLFCKGFSIGPEK